MSIAYSFIILYNYCTIISLFDIASEVQHDAKHLQTCNTTEPVSTDILNPPTEGE